MLRVSTFFSSFFSFCNFNFRTLQLNSFLCSFASYSLGCQWLFKVFFHHCIRSYSCGIVFFFIFFLIRERIYFQHVLVSFWKCSTLILTFFEFTEEGKKIISKKCNKTKRTRIDSFLFLMKRSVYAEPIKIIFFCTFERVSKRTNFRSLN